MVDTDDAAQTDVRRGDVEVGALPSVYGPLIGRDGDLARAAALIGEGRRPVLTVIGPGGVGKTRLAIALGERLSGRHADGVRFVRLASERTAADAEARIRHSAGNGGSGALDVRSWLASRDVLLILDNLEQIPDAGALVAALAPRRGDSRLLVTSRGPLHIAAEQVLRLDPLPTRPGGGRSGTHRGPAVALFVDTASAADASYAPDGAELDQIGELCRRLDGLPLAIRLAAQRRRLLGVPEMLRRIEADRTLLAGSSPDLDDRQRTIERSIAWSLDLLTAAERADAHLLSLPPAGWSYESIAAVEPPIELATLERHRDLGLLARDGDRLGMLQTVRDVVSASESTVSQTESIRRLIDATERNARRLATLGASPPALAEDANLRRVVQLLSEQGDADRLLRLVCDLDRYWKQSGTTAGVLPPLQWALDVAELPDASDQLRVLQLASLACGLAGEVGEGLRLANNMVTLADERGSVQERLWARNALGGAQVTAGQLATAFETFKATLAFEEAGADVTKILVNLAGVAVALNRNEEALRYLAEANARATDASGLARHPVPLLHLAQLSLRAGDLDAARNHLVESLARSVEIHERIWQLGGVVVTGDLADAYGDTEAAAALVARVEAFLDRERMDLSVVADERELARITELRRGVGPERWAALRRVDVEAGLPGLVATALAWLNRPAATASEPASGPLTPREDEIARLVAAGRTNQQIADALFLSPRTVQTHVANMLKKLELPSRSALAAWQATRESASTSGF